MQGTVVETEQVSGSQILLFLASDPVVPLPFPDILAAAATKSSEKLGKHLTFVQIIFKSVIASAVSVV